MRMVIVLLFLATSSYAADIPKEARVSNCGNYCGWACLDTLARTHDIRKLRGILRDRWIKKQGMPDPSYDPWMQAELEQRGVRYEIKPQLSFDRVLLNRYANTLGVSVSLKRGNPYSIGCHQIIVTYYDDMLVQFYDSNHPEKLHLTCNRQWFDAWWLGNSLVVFPDEA